MKKAFKLILMVMAAPLLLGGCNSGDGGSTTPPATSQPQQHNVRYFKGANDSIVKIGSTEFLKRYEGFCAVGLATIDGKSGPVLVGEDQVQVIYMKNGSSNKLYKYGGKVVVNDKTYYYSSVDGFVSGKLDGSRDYENYISDKTSLEEVAKDIISKATFEAVDPSKKVYFNYKERNVGGYEISAGPYAETLEDLLIPSTYQDEDVTAVAEEGFRDLIRLKSVRFDGKKIQSLGKSAFNGCSSLSYALIPNSVTEVGAWCFDNCNKQLLVFSERAYTTSYGYQWLGNSDTAVTQRAFWEYKDYFVDGDFVYGLKIDNNIGIIRYRGEGDYIELPTDYQTNRITIIEKYSFKGKTLIRNVEFPEFLEEIGDEAFRDCTRLCRIKLPYSVKSVGKSAFNTCTSLEYAVLSESLSKVGAYCFDNCNELRGIFINLTKGSFNYDYKWNGEKKVYYQGEWYFDSFGDPRPNEA